MKIDAVVEEYLNYMEVPGAAFGIIKDGEIIFAKGYGLRNVEENLPVTTRTLFPIGSSTKAFTSFLLGQLIDEGLFSWDDPISEHIPYFRLSNPQTTYEITIRDYLIHLSGYPTHDGIWYNEEMAREDLIRRLRYVEPVTPFRKEVCYQSIGYMVAAHVAERITGKSWEELTAERIFQPLGMVDSNCTLEALKASRDYATGYVERGNSTVEMAYLNASPIGPGAAINSNLEDLLRWAGALLAKGDGLLESSTWQEIVKPHVLSSIIRKEGYETAKELILEAYGLGWIVLPYKNHRMLLHGGYINGFSSNVLLLPDDNLAIVILSNKHYSPLAYLLPSMALDELLDFPPTEWLERYKAIYKEYQAGSFQEQSEALKLHRKEGTKTSHPLSDYEGLYEHPAYGSCEIKVQNDVLMNTFHQMTFPIEHWHYDVFSVPTSVNIADIEGLKCTFENNAYGEISALTIPFEKALAPIRFHKTKEAKRFDADYLHQFTGFYSYLGFSIHVTSDGNQLLVKAMGQPPYYLRPEKESLFSVQDYEGSFVQFLRGEEDIVSAVQLIQPDNKIYTARRS